MIIFIAMFVVILTFVALMYVLRARDKQEEVPPIIDENDPMNDPAVRAMMYQVLQTGRPMAMNRGEKPKFIDE